MKALRLLFLYFFFSASAFAVDVGYEVEIIIFEDISGVYDHSEKWSMPEEENGPVLANGNIEKPVSKIVNPEKLDKQYREITSNNFRLNAQVNRLTKHPDYRVLVHKAWRQTGLDKDKAFPVRVDSGTTNGAGNRQTASSEQPGSRISGDIKLIMSRYLHINTDLIYQKPSQTSSPTFTNMDTAIDSNYESHKLVFERRMRSKELHYIDHPLVGIIVLATPFEIKTERSKPVGSYKTL